MGKNDGEQNLETNRQEGERVKRIAMTKGVSKHYFTHIDLILATGNGG